MSAGKEKVRIGIDFKRCLTDNVHSVNHFTEHGCDFMVTKLFDETVTNSLTNASPDQRYLGDTDATDMLNSLNWSNLVVSRLCVDPHLEDGDCDQITAAEDALQVREDRLIERL